MTEVGLHPLSGLLTDPNALTTGEATFDRTIEVSAITGTSQALRLAYLTAKKTETITQIRTLTALVAAGATPTVNRVGIYTVAANGDITLAASCAHNTSMWSVAGTPYTVALTSSFAKVAGQRLAIGLLCVTSATAPTWPGLANGQMPASEFGQSPRLSGVVTSQTDLPSSVAAGSIADTSSCPYAVLVP